MSVNLDGVFLTVRAAAREMVKAGKGGRIITIASAAARIATPGMADYTASKAGVWGLTNTVAKELAQYGITANTIGPGLIDTSDGAGLHQHGEGRAGPGGKRVLTGGGQPVLDPGALRRTQRHRQHGAVPGQ